MIPECRFHTSKHSESVMVLGCMSYQSSRRHHFVQGIVNDDQYAGVLKDELLSSARDMYLKQK